MLSCRKNRGKKTEKLIVQNCVRIDWDSAFWAKKILRKIFIQCKRVRFTVWFRLCLSMPSSLEHSCVCLWNTRQLTLRATWKRTQQFTMLRVFAWGKKFDWFQTLPNNFDPNKTEQHATACAKWNSTGSCWPTMLHPFATVFYWSKLLCEKKHK